MAKLIAQSLHEDSDVFSDEFMQDYDLHSGIDNRIATAAYNALKEQHIDIEIAQQHCDHWDYPHNTVEVNIGRGRYRDYCQHCAHDDDIVIETYDTGIMMLRDEAYWCDDNEEYYEHEHEPELDEDDDEDEDEDDEDETPKRRKKKQKAQTSKHGASWRSGWCGARASTSGRVMVTV